MYIHSSTLYSTKEYAKPQWLGLFQCHTITGIDMTRSELITTIAIEVETLYILVLGLFVKCFFCGTLPGHSSVHLGKYWDTWC